MAKNREAALKRAREKARLDKREAKRAKKEAKQAAESEDENIDERALWEQFARLSESHEAGRISAARYDDERQRILEALGIDTSE